MSDWRDLCGAKDLALDVNGIVVTFSGGRTQRVRVDVERDAYRLSSTVLGARRRERITEAHGEHGAAWLALRILRRNRSAPLVGFRIDAQNRVLAEAHVPRAGVTGAEFAVYVRTLAQEADRLEFLLTGEDRN